MYRCPRCDFTTNKKSTITDHFNRKVSCSADHPELLTPEEIKKTCLFCGKILANINRHNITCKLKREKLKSSKELQPNVIVNNNVNNNNVKNKPKSRKPKPPKELQPNVIVNNNVNNNNVNNNNVNNNTIGYENTNNVQVISFAIERTKPVPFSQSNYTKILKYTERIAYSKGNLDIPMFLLMNHFNDAIPENKNIKIDPVTKTPYILGDDGSYEMMSLGYMGYVDIIKKTHDNVSNDHSDDLIFSCTAYYTDSYSSFPEQCIDVAKKASELMNLFASCNRYYKAVIN